MLTLKKTNEIFPNSHEYVKKDCSFQTGNMWHWTHDVDTIFILRALREYTLKICFKMKDILHFNVP